MGLHHGWWRRRGNRSAARLVRTGCVMLALALSALALPAAAAALTPPQSDPFYKAPAKLASYSLGTILRSRPVTLAAFGPLPQHVQAWQLLYRTTNYQGRPEATVTTVLLPAGGKKPRGLISYQVAEDAVAPQCAMSYTLREATRPEVVNQAEILLIDAAVAQGFAISVPDYEGPHGDFGAPRQPGYAILDGIRAAERFKPLGLNGTRTPVGIWGYSGGSLASGWAAQVQPHYAPKLNVKGIAVGGFATNLGQALTKINGGVGSGLIFSVLDGVARSQPAIAAALNTYVTPTGKAMLARGASQCEVANLTQYDFKNINRYLTISLAKLVVLPAVKRALGAVDLGGTAPKVPLFVYHAVNDELIPVAGVDAIVKKYCAAGDSVTYTRDSLSEHVTLAFIGAPEALNWLTERLTGGAVPRGCSTTTVPTMVLNPITLTSGAQLVFADAFALLDQPIGASEIF